MISSEAMRPGDILVASNGKTIEVLNTDAEGRLTLADALVYAERLQVDQIIDMATLTGASIVGLGEKVAAFYTADEGLRQSLLEASRVSTDKLWEMPLEESYAESITSKIADLKNISGLKGGGSITAALFLKKFVEKTPWAHIGKFYMTVMELLDH
jgi:leucyl aminopeptidase